MLKLMEVSEGFYKAINIVSDHIASIDRDMLGDYRGTVEIMTSNGFEAVESDSYSTIEEAARWIECRVGENEIGGTPVILSVTFDGSPMIVS